jgi:hypothetical protein
VRGIVPTSTADRRHRPAHPEEGEADRTAPGEAAGAHHPGRDEGLDRGSGMKESGGVPALRYRCRRAVHVLPASGGGRVRGLSATPTKVEDGVPLVTAGAEKRTHRSFREPRVQRNRSVIRGVHAPGPRTRKVTWCSRPRDPWGSGAGRGTDRGVVREIIPSV